MRPSLGGPIAIGDHLVDIDAKEVYPGSWHGYFSSAHARKGFFSKITDQNFRTREEAEREAFIDALSYIARQWQISSRG